jgi:hypothetical protein
MQKANITRQPTNNVTVLINNIEKAFQLLRVSKGGEPTVQLPSVKNRQQMSVKN